MKIFVSKSFQFKKMFSCNLGQIDSKTKNMKNMKKRPKRLKNPFEMLKYFISHTSLHGIKYVQDLQLYKLERIVWFLLVIAGFYCAVKVITQLYSRFQAKQTNVIIDEIHYDIFHVPFPSVTICPGSRVDWKKVNKVVNAVVPPQYKAANSIITSLLKNMSKLRFSHLHDLEIDAHYSDLELLNDINITDVLIQVLPKCEQLIFNCSWSYAKVNCCEVFELQKTAYGFCYSFNSLTSVNVNPQKQLRKAHAYGIRSGLKILMRGDYVHYPPNSKDNKTAFFIISHPMIYPSKARYITLGSRYNAALKFTSAFASPEVLDLENDESPPCKYKNGSYKFENCLAKCRQKYIQKKCGCNPTFLFPFASDARECSVADLTCIAKESGSISETHFSLVSDEPHLIKTLCNCPTECSYCSYDDFVISLPFYEPNAVVLDVHFDGPTGVRYKREIVITDLDMLVQLGGIFGLFLGGSLLTIMEFTYCFLCAMIFFFYQSYTSKERKKDENKIQHNVIHVTSSSSAADEKRIYPLLDLSGSQQKNFRY